MLLNMLPTSESEQVEFKTSFNEDVIISLVAFSNTKGGVVYVGMSDNAEVKGIQIGKETIQNWINEVKNKTTPQLVPDADILVFEDKSVIALSITEYPIKPVAVRGRFYKRINNSNHLMSIDEISNEHLKTINSSWDYYVDPNHDLDAISLDKVERFVNKIQQRSQNELQLTPLEFITKMEILREGKLTFGGYLLFAKDYCLISDIQVGRFKSDITIIDSISLNFDLFTEVDEVIAFIKKHLMIEYIITGNPQRTERFDYPLDAIREIVTNMIVHRDYRESSGSIIKIYDDRIEFYNPGKLYGGTTIQDLFSGNYTSKSRNKLIAKAFKEIGLIERYGSGIIRIRNICKEYGIVEPSFSEIANGFMVTLFKEKIIDLVYSAIEHVNVPVNEPVNISEYVSVNELVDSGIEPVNEPVNERQLMIILLIQQNKHISLNELSAKCKVGRETIKRDMKILKILKIVERIGSDKDGFWKIIKD